MTSPIRHFNPMQFGGYQGANVGPTSSYPPKSSSFGGLNVPPIPAHTMRQSGPTSQVYPGQGSTNFPKPVSGPKTAPIPSFATPPMSTQFPKSTPVSVPKGKQTVPGGKAKSGFSFKAPGKAVRVGPSKHAGNNERVLKSATGAK